MALSNKQQVFVSEYLKCWNATEAARRAGYAEKYLNTNASKLLQNTTIAAEIKRNLEERQLSADEVLARLGDMARADIADFTKVRKIADLEDGRYKGKTHVIKKFKSKITRDALDRMIEEVELELYPADGALEKVGRHHGLFVDEHRVTVIVEKELNRALDKLQQGLDADTYAAILAILTDDEISEGQAGEDPACETES